MSRRFFKAGDHIWVDIDEVVAIEIVAPYGVYHHVGWAVDFLLKSGKAYRVPTENYDEAEMIVQRYFNTVIQGGGE